MPEAESLKSAVGRMNVQKRQGSCSKNPGKILGLLIQGVQVTLLRHVAYELVFRKLVGNRKVKQL